jgi:hypothetical protein
MTLLHWQHSSKTNERKMHIMQIAMQKRKKISASAVGTPDFFYRPHYISFGPLQKTALCRWNFHTEDILVAEIFVIQA